MDRIHHQRALHGNEAAQAGIAAFEFLRHQAVGDVGHSGAAVALQVRAKKSQLAQFRHQLHREGRFAIVFFDDRDDVLVDKLPRRLARQQLFVIEQRIEVQKIHAGKRGHQILLVVCRTKEKAGEASPVRNGMRRARRAIHSSALVSPQQAGDGPPRHETRLYSSAGEFLRVRLGWRSKIILQKGNQPLMGLRETGCDAIKSLLYSDRNCLQGWVCTSGIPEMKFGGHCRVP